MRGYLNPRAGAPQSILTIASFRGIGIVADCGLVFCGAFGFGCSAYAAVSCVLNVSSRLAFIAAVVSFFSSAACAVVSFRLVVGACFAFVVLHCISLWCWSFCVRGGFLSFFPLFGASCPPTDGEVGEFAS